MTQMSFDYLCNSVVIKMKKTALALALSFILSGCNSSSSNIAENQPASTTGQTPSTSASSKIPSQMSGLVSLNINGYSVNGMITPDGFFVGNTPLEAVYVGQFKLNGSELSASIDFYRAGDRGQYVETYTELKGELSPDNTFVISNNDGNSVSSTMHFPSQYPEYLADISAILDPMSDDAEIMINTGYPNIKMRKDMSVYSTKDINYFWPNCEGTGAYQPLNMSDQDYMVGSITFSGCTGLNQDDQNGAHMLFSFTDRDDDGVIYMNNFMIKDKVIANMLSD